MGRNARIFNLMSIIFVLLTIAVIVVVIIRYGAGPVERPQTVAQLPPLLVLPSFQRLRIPRPTR
jgi:hypothetical protein